MPGPRNCAKVVRCVLTFLLFAFSGGWVAMAVASVFVFLFFLFVCVPFASSFHFVLFAGDDCSHGPWEGERICNYNMERVRFGTAAKVCQSKGLQICTEKLEGYGCSYDDMHVWTQDQPTFAWVVFLVLCYRPDFVLWYCGPAEWCGLFYSHQRFLTNLKEII